MILSSRLPLAASVLLSACALLAGAAQAEGRWVGASHLLGARIVSPEGERVAVVHDLALDVRSGRVAYVIADPRQPSRPQGRLRAVSLQTLRPGLARDQLVLDPGSATTGASAPQARPDAQLMRASSVLGLEVEHPAGAAYGTIEDLLFDFDSGVLRSAQVRLDAGPGGVLREVPFSALRFPARGQAAILTLYQGSAPGTESYAAATPSTLRASELLGMEVRNDGGETGQIAELAVDIGNNRVHYAVLDFPGRQLTQPLKALEIPPGASHARLGALADRPAAPRAGMTLARASRLLGAQFENPPGRDLGRITELAVDSATGAIPYALVRLQDDPRGALRTAPLDAFALYPGRKNLVLTIDPATLPRARQVPSASLRGG